jgi:hypothetical protein
MNHHKLLEKASSQTFLFYPTDIAITRQILKLISKQCGKNSHSSETKPVPYLHPQRFPFFFFFLAISLTVQLYNQLMSHLSP